MHMSSSGVALDPGEEEGKSYICGPWVFSYQMVFLSTNPFFETWRLPMGVFTWLCGIAL